MKKICTSNRIGTTARRGSGTRTAKALSLHASNGKSHGIHVPGADLHSESLAARLRRHATERHHAAPSSESRWTTAKRPMTPAEASLKGVDRPPAIKERTTIWPDKLKSVV